MKNNHIKNVIDKFDRRFLGEMKQFSLNWGMESNPKPKIKTFIIQSHKDFLLSEIERLRGEEYKDGCSGEAIDCGSVKYNQALQDQISHLKEQLKEIEQYGKKQ